MNKSIIRCLVVGWIGTMGWVSLGQAVLAGGPEPAPRIAVYVYNWAQVESNTLREAKEVATQIFREAGVEAVLFDVVLTFGKEPAVAEGQPPLLKPRLFVHLIPRPMAERLGRSADVLGVAFGTPQERNRNLVYVFDPVAERMAQKQVIARGSGTVFINANKGQILGHGMAHEIGHILLHQASHSPEGLMRANWDRNDMQNMVAGDLLFTPEQEERIRAEVARRNGSDSSDGVPSEK